METIDTSSLSTKIDLVQLEVKIYKAMFLQSFVTIGLVVGLLKFLN